MTNLKGSGTAIYPVIDEINWSKYKQKPKLTIPLSKHKDT